jgi:hypothetical protein
VPSACLRARAIVISTCLFVIAPPLTAVFAWSAVAGVELDEGRFAGRDHLAADVEEVALPYPVIYALNQVAATSEIDQESRCQRPARRS